MGSYTKKFTKKKVTGAKLFDMSEKQLRKLVKQEDDFVLFKRSLRQAIAYYSTTADRSRATPFRPVRRTNPLADEGNSGVLGAMDRLNRYRPEPDDRANGGDDEYLGITSPAKASGQRRLVEQPAAVRSYNT